MGRTRNSELRGVNIRAKDATAATEDNGVLEVARNESLSQSVVRAHAWVNGLRDGAYDSIKQLAEANRIHPKVVGQALRLAFLSTGVTSTSAILEGRQPTELSLAQIPKLLPLSWAEHRRVLG
jgi:site-specific DNA recombinase